MKVTVNGQPIKIEIEDDSAVIAVGQASQTFNIDNPVQNIDVETVNTNVIVGELGLQGPPGPAGSGSQSYVHNQTVSAAVWTIVHNLGIYPNVHIENSAGDTVEGEIDYPDVNTVVLTFSGAFTGVAYLS